MDSSTYVPIARLDKPEKGAPAHADIDGIDHGPIRRGDQRLVFEGRGALLIGEGSGLLPARTDAELV